MRKISVALLQELCNKWRQSSLCTSLKHMGNGVIAPPILELSTTNRGAWSALGPGYFFLRKEPSVKVHIDEELGWAPQPLWMLWTKERSHICRKTKYDSAASKRACNLF
jgi:hypothetical protein